MRISVNDMSNRKFLHKRHKGKMLHLFQQNYNKRHLPVEMMPYA